MLKCVFQNFKKESTNEFDINPLNFVSLPGHTCQCELDYTDMRLQTFQDKDMILLIGNNIRGGICSIVGGRYVVSDDN